MKHIEVKDIRMMAGKPIRLTRHNKKEFAKGMLESLMWGREGYKVSKHGKIKCLTQKEIDILLSKNGFDRQENIIYRGL